MRNEWRGNLWMVIELVIVGLVLWGLFASFAFWGNVHQGPDGYDLTDVYVGTIKEIPENASTYTPYPDSLHNTTTDLENLLANLRNNPYVEVLGMGKNAIPYSYNYTGNALAADIDGKRESYNGNCRVMSSDLIRTIRLRGQGGETTEELAQMIDNGNILISTYERPVINDVDVTTWRGRDVFWEYDSTRVEHVGAIIKGIRRTDYEPCYGMVVMPKKSWGTWDEIAIRVKPGKGAEFLASLKTDDLERGNVYISDLRSIDQLRDQVHMDINNTLKAMTASALFVMVAVFLGFFGSFWYKTQQRVPELALRMVNGATRASLFRRLLSEGMILLAISAVPIAATGIFILSRLDIAAEVNAPFPDWIPWVTFGTTLAALALIIGAGIGIPAYRTMKINPAEALKDQ